MECVGVPGTPVMTTAIITLITSIYDPPLGQDAGEVLALYKRKMKGRLHPTGQTLEACAEPTS
jgi:hypothetical protein